MIKRIVNFKKDDWEHIRWLLKTMMINFVQGDLNGLIEGFYLIKLHISHDCKAIK